MKKSDNGPPAKVVREFRRNLERQARIAERVLIAAFESGAKIVVVGDVLDLGRAPKSEAPVRHSHGSGWWQSGQKVYHLQNSSQEMTAGS
jgi:hypothetical protein